MKDRVIVLNNKDTKLYVRFEKKHWWNKWKLYAIGYNIDGKHGVLSTYQDDVKIKEEFV